MLPVRFPWQVLCHYIRRHIRCREIRRANDVPVAGVSDEVVSDTDVLSTLVELRVLG